MPRAPKSVCVPSEKCARYFFSGFELRDSLVRRTLREVVLREVLRDLRDLRDLCGISAFTIRARQTCVEVFLQRSFQRLRPYHVSTYQQQGTLRVPCVYCQVPQRLPSLRRVQELQVPLLLTVCPEIPLDVC